MAINFNDQNQGIGSFNLGDFGLQQPEENMTVAEAINYGVLPQAKDTFTPEFPMGAKMNPGVKEFMKNNPTPTKASFVEALEAGKFGGATGGMFDKNVGALFEGVPLDASFFSTEVGDVNPQFISPKGSFGGTIDIRKDQLANPEDLPGGFFKSVGDQSSLGLPADDKFAMAISNYDQLFGPTTMTDSFGTTYNIPGAERPDIFTGLMDVKTGEALRDPFGPIEGISDRGRGMAGPAGPAFEMIGGQAVPVGDVLGRQMALEKSNLMDEPKSQSGFGIGELLSLVGLLTQSKPIQGMSMIANRDKIGKGIGNITAGLGSLNRGLSRRMRGVNPDGTIRTQSQFEQDRANRSLNNRLDYMLDRKKKGKSYSKKNLARVQEQINNRINRDERDALTNRNKSVNYGVTGGPTRTDIDVADGGAGTGGGRSKVVCTMMNDRYGFGSFRNKIWMKFHESYGPEYQKGYHAIFLPLVKIAKGEGKINTAVRKVLEHMGRHVTADMFKIMKGKKRDPLGRIYRAIFEPTCRIIGKIKSALGRG